MLISATDRRTAGGGWALRTIAQWTGTSKLKIKYKFELIKTNTFIIIENTCCKLF